MILGQFTVPGIDFAVVIPEPSRLNEKYQIVKTRPHRASKSWMVIER